MNLPAVRPQEHEAAYYNNLPLAVRKEIELWGDIVEFVGGFKSAVAGYAAAAEKWEWMGAYSEVTIKRKLQAYKKKKSWKVFLDKRKLNKPTSSKNIVVIYRDYALSNQRSNHEGWQRMLLDFKSGKHFSDVGDWRTVWSEQHRGRTVPDQYPIGWIPNGWSYDNLQKLSGISNFEIVASRKGRAAARDFLPPVLTTRVGLKPGQMFQMDDVWHDCVINAIGTNRRPQREIEFCMIDVASAHKTAYGLQPRREDTRTGKMKNVPETRALELLAYQLCYVGYHPETCTVIGEHGTASVPADVAKYLSRHSGGALKFTAGGIISASMHKGLYPGQGRGNFKLKASLESQHGLYHSAAAHLPGQVGMDPAHAPEEHGKLAKYNEHLLTCYHALAKISPERAAMLAFDVLTHEEYISAISGLYQIVSERTDHQLEGWRSAGNVITEFRVSASASDWISIYELENFPPQEQAMIRAIIRAQPEVYTRSRQLSRLEVWDNGKDDLIKFSRFSMPHILGEKLGVERTVGADGMISFKNENFGPDEYFYNARAMHDPSGFVVSLRPQRSYIIHANPFNLNEIFVSDKDSGSVLGIIPRYGVPVKTDLDSIYRQIGNQQKTNTKLMQPLINSETQRKRAETRLKNLETNNDALRGTSGESEFTTPTQREEEAEVVADFDPLDFYANMENNDQETE